MILLLVSARHGDTEQANAPPDRARSERRSARRCRGLWATGIPRVQGPTMQTRSFRRIGTHPNPSKAIAKYSRNDLAAAERAHADLVVTNDKQLIGHAPSQRSRRRGFLPFWMRFLAKRGDARAIRNRAGAASDSIAEEDDRIHGDARLRSDAPAKSRGQQH